MRLSLLAGAAATLMLGGCAPQMYFARGPGSCGVMQRGASHRTGIMATTARVQALQARHSLSYQYVVRSSAAPWKAAATGECR
jgi:hypothetical protein